MQKEASTDVEKKVIDEVFDKKRRMKKELNECFNLMTFFNMKKNADRKKKEDRDELNF
jgi:hypothetical protein